MELKLRINNRKNSRKVTSVENMCSNATMGNNKMVTEIRNYLDEWKTNPVCPNLVITVYVPKEERSLISHPTLYAKGTGKKNVSSTLSSQKEWENREY